MVRWKSLALGFALLAFAALATIGIWGMGPAVFIDSKRTVLSATPSPNGKRIAQVERLTVGGVPNVVVTVRSWWSPNWYLAGCTVVSHYHDAVAKAHWTSDTALEVVVDDLQFWQTDMAPFQRTRCKDFRTTLIPLPRKS